MRGKQRCEHYDTRFQFENIETDFKEDLEPVSEYLKTPCQYFTDILTDDMFELLQAQTNVYSLSKHGIEIKITKKELEIFVGFTYELKGA